MANSKKNYSFLSKTTRYTNMAIFLHWLIGLSIIFMFLLGWFMEGLPKEAPKSATYDLFNLGLYTWELASETSPRSFYFNLHKSIGLTLFALILFRVFWRFTHKPPALLPTMKSWEKKLAAGAHHGLYLLMILTPLAGIIMSVASKYGIKWFGIEVIPGLDFPSIRELFIEFHEIFGLLIVFILIFHIAGALKHTIVDKDGTLRRMWFK
ncbi:MAG: cytochrome b [Methylophilales bacterium]|jgi:cytochrome b561|nr:cytochrome b [Pseudomonadota bacterium]NQW34871.1 cytochrome b [Methylophilales bacterium]HCK04015.1 cytochrome B [Methylophilaceae bacterium]|tara:strand:+ start:9013 stop:9639 length:627 start_codon:yes stop_codon:yes gene_type:complete